MGKPVYHRFTDANIGSWMRDSAPRSDVVGEKFWTTREAEINYLYEYNNKSAFRRDQPSRTYKLQFPFMVILHILFDLIRELKLF